LAEAKHKSLPDADKRLRTTMSTACSRLSKQDHYEVGTLQKLYHSCIDV